MQNRFLTESDPTTAWAKAAVDGRLTVGDIVRAQAERHLRDIRDGEARGIYWRPEAAAHALGFLPAVFSVTDGPAAGRAFHPLEWHTFVVGSLFGWLTSTGRWRFRTGWLETGKGQAKSPLMGAIGVYIMGWCGIPRAQCFAIGQDKATANVLFRDAVAMCRGQIPDEEEGDTLEARGEVIIRGEGDNAWKLEHPDTGAANAARHPWGDIKVTVSGDANLIKPDPLIDMIYALPAAYSPGAKFYSNRGALGAVRKLKDGQGNYLWQPTYVAGQPSTLAGYPLVDMPDMPLPTAGLVPLLFGDMARTYLIIDRIGVRVLRDPYTNKPYVSFYTTKRVGGGVQNPDAMKAYKISV